MFSELAPMDEVIPVQNAADGLNLVVHNGEIHEGD
jgi:hypothetical protein